MTRQDKEMERQQIIQNAVRQSERKFWEAYRAKQRELEDAAQPTSLGADRDR